MVAPELRIGLLIAGVSMLGCVSPTSAPPPTHTQYWGDMTAVVSVKELMRDMIDPSADQVFLSVSAVTDKHGTVETSPKTDQDWARIRAGGVALAEGASLLKIPRPFAPPGEENESAGPDAPELSPAQIKAKLEKDPVLWNAKVQALRNVGLEVLEIVKERNAQKLWDAGEDIEMACESCHVQFWYPGDPALYRRLDRRLEGLYGRRKNRIPLSTELKP